MGYRCSILGSLTVVPPYPQCTYKSLFVHTLMEECELDRVRMCFLNLALSLYLMWTDNFLTCKTGVWVEEWLSGLQTGSILYLLLMMHGLLGKSNEDSGLFFLRHTQSNTQT